MANKNKPGKKKTRSELDAYKQYVKSDTHFQQDTVAIDNVNLHGSDEMNNSVYLSSEKPVVPWHYKVKKFLKSHITETIILSILCTFIAWAAATLHNAKVDIAVIQTRLDYLEDQVDGLHTDSATKEIIDLQIEAIKQDLSSTFEVKTTELSSQLDLIEQQIEYIEKNSAGNTE